MTCSSFENLFYAFDDSSDFDVYLKISWDHFEIFKDCFQHLMLSCVFYGIKLAQEKTFLKLWPNLRCLHIPRENQATRNSCLRRFCRHPNLAQQIFWVPHWRSSWWCADFLLLWLTSCRSEELWVFCSPLKSPIKSQKAQKPKIRSPRQIFVPTDSSIFL